MRSKSKALTSFWLLSFWSRVCLPGSCTYGSGRNIDGVNRYENKRSYCPCGQYERSFVWLNEQVAVSEANSETEAMTLLPAAIVNEAIFSVPCAFILVAIVTVAAISSRRIKVITSMIVSTKSHLIILTPVA